jgi:TorA maturation chaperone TorD
MESQQDFTNKRDMADSCRFLSACFYIPRKELFIQAGLFKNLTYSLTRTCAGAVVFSSEMERTFLEADEEELKVEYARLFVGPFELKAPPYGSVYLDGERKVMGDSTMEVMKLYEKAGLFMDKDFKELPDHIAAELEFMYYLIWKEAEALEKLETEKALFFNEMRDKFFNHFLSPWVPSFCQRIKESTDNPFYIALADCLSTFITNQGKNRTLSFQKPEETLL